MLIGKKLFPFSFLHAFLYRQIPQNICINNIFLVYTNSLVNLLEFYENSRKRTVASHRTNYSVVLMYSSIWFFFFFFVINMSKSCFVRWFRVLSSPNPNQFPFVTYFRVVFHIVCFCVSFFVFIHGVCSLYVFLFRWGLFQGSTAAKLLMDLAWRAAAASARLSSFECHKNDLGLLSLLAGLIKSLRHHPALPRTALGANCIQIKSVSSAAVNVPLRSSSVVGSSSQCQGQSRAASQQHSIAANWLTRRRRGHPRSSRQAGRRAGGRAGGQLTPQAAWVPQPQLQLPLPLPTSKLTY